MVEGLIIIVMLGVCFGALIVSLSNKKEIGCQSLNCKCKNKYGK